MLTANLARFFENLEDEEEPESEYSLEAPTPGFEFVKRIMTQIAEDNRLPVLFTDCSYYSDKFPETAEDMELEILDNDRARVFDIPLRDVPPLLNFAFEHLLLRIAVLEADRSEAEHVIEVSLCYYPRHKTDAKLLRILARYREIDGELSEESVTEATIPYNNRIGIYS